MRMWPPGGRAGLCTGVPGTPRELGRGRPRQLAPPLHAASLPTCPQGLGEANACSGCPPVGARQPPASAFLQQEGN